MAGGRWDYPEHFEAGLKPHGVREKYYFARGPQLVNRVVDITSTFDQKVDVNVANDTQGPAGVSGSRLLGNDDATANREYIKQIVLLEDAAVGKKHGVAYGEPFHYIGPKASMLDDYIKKNAVPL
jgi:hypothetical protein